MAAGSAVAITAPVLTVAAFAARVTERLSFDLPADWQSVTGAAPVAGDHRLDGLPPATSLRPRPAAVLIAAVEREGGASVLMTLRASTLRKHSGQIAFPGGKIDPEDATPAAAALREAWEEVGLDPARVTPLGYLDPYLTGTGYLILPTVATVEPPFDLVPNPDEVEDVFEVPLAFLMDQANHQRDSREFNGRLRSFYVMAYGERRIWGVTAGLIRNLYERLYA